MSNAKHRPYADVTGQPHDFVVKYRILTEAEGGRTALPYQGIRWDMYYEHPEHRENQIFMIAPEFLDENGSVITQKSKPVPRAGKARMWIVDNKWRKYHQDKITLGMKCFGREGPHTVAHYEVIEIVGLMTNPTT